MITNEQMARLPKAVKEHIEGLSRREDDARRELARLLDNDTPSNLYISSRVIEIGGKKYIQADSVSFNLGDSEIEVRLKDGELELMARGFKSKLSIKPHVTNVIHVTTVCS